MKKNIRIFAIALIALFAGSFAFADSAMDDFLTSYDTFVKTVEASAKAKEYDTYDTYEAANKLCMEEKSTLEAAGTKMGIIQKFKFSRMEARYSKAMATLKAGEKTSEVSDSAKEATEKLKEKASELTTSAKNAIKEKASEIGDSISDAAEEKVNETKDSAGTAIKEKASEVKDAATEKAKDASKKISEKASALLEKLKKATETEEKEE